MEGGRVGTRSLVVLLIALVCTVNGQDSSTASPSGVLNTITRVSDRINEAMEATDGNTTRLSFSNIVRLLPPAAVEQLETMAKGEAWHDRVQRMNTATNDQIKHAVIWAQEYVATHPEVVEETEACLGRNLTGVHCDLMGQFEKATHQFTADLSGPDVMPGHAGRPAAYAYKNKGGIRLDLNRFFFWISIMIVFATSHVAVGSEQLTTIYSNLLHAVTSAGPNGQKTHEEAVVAEDEKALVQRWRTLMSVFPTYMQFKRAMEHDSSFSELAADMCKNERSMEVSMFSLIGQQANEASADGLENCWLEKKTSVFKAIDPEGTIAERNILGVPTMPAFLVAAFAAGLLLRSEEQNTYCDNTWPTKVSDWQCSNGNNEGSICLLSCQNTATAIRKITWGLSTVRICDKGLWKPQIATQLSKCSEMGIEAYEYGITRLTPQDDLD